MTDLLYARYLDVVKSHDILNTSKNERKYYEKWLKGVLNIE